MSILYGSIEKTPAFLPRKAPMIIRAQRRKIWGDNQPPGTRALPHINPGRTQVFILVRKSFLHQEGSSLSPLHHQFPKWFLKSQTLNLENHMAENCLRTSDLRHSDELLTSQYLSLFFCPLAMLFAHFYHNNMGSFPFWHCKIYINMHSPSTPGPALQKEAKSFNWS